VRVPFTGANGKEQQVSRSEIFARFNPDKHHKTFCRASVY
jgi:hypothetical protein